MESAGGFRPEIFCDQPITYCCLYRGRFKVRCRKRIARQRSCLLAGSLIRIWERYRIVPLRWENGRTPRNTPLSVTLPNLVALNKRYEKRHSRDTGRLPDCNFLLLINIVLFLSTVICLTDSEIKEDFSGGRKFFIPLC